MKVGKIVYNMETTNISFFIRQKEEAVKLARLISEKRHEKLIIVEKENKK